MASYTTVLFDIDGTLVDSNAAHAQAWHRAAKQHGFDREVAFFDPLIGMGGDRILPEIDPALNPETDTGKAILADRKQTFLNELAPAVRPFSDAAALVRACSERGMRCIIATSSTPQELDTALGLLGIEDLLAASVTSEDVSHAKPAPDVVAVALEKSGAEPEQAILIGDTAYDIESAGKVGVATIALRCGGSSDERLRGALRIYDDPSELLKELDQIIGDVAPTPTIR